MNGKALFLDLLVLLFERYLIFTTLQCLSDAFTHLQLTLILCGKRPEIQMLLHATVIWYFGFGSGKVSSIVFMRHYLERKLTIS